MATDEGADYIESNAVYFTSNEVEDEAAVMEAVMGAVMAYDAVFDMSDMVALTAATSSTATAPVGVAGFEREVKVKSLSDEEYKLLMKAVEKEWRSLLDNEVFEPVTLKEMRQRCEGQGKDGRNVQALPMKWVFQWKIDDAGNKGIKARLFFVYKELKWLRLNHIGTHPV